MFPVSELVKWAKLIQLLIEIVYGIKQCWELNSYSKICPFSKEILSTVNKPTITHYVFPRCQTMLFTKEDLFVSGR